MPARRGDEYIEGLKAPREVWLGRERVADVTSHPGLRRDTQTITGLYDLQWEPEHH